MITPLKGINERCACLHLRKAARAVTQYFDHALEPLGLRSTQFNLLISMASVGVNTLTEMANMLVMDRTTLTRNLKPLEKLGFIMTADAKDRRSKTYKLTEKGQSVLAQCVPVWERLQNHIEHTLTSDRYHTLTKELEAFTKVINEQIHR